MGDDLDGEDFTNWAILCRDGKHSPSGPTSCNQCIKEMEQAECVKLNSTLKKKSHPFTNNFFQNV